MLSCVKQQSGKSDLGLCVNNGKSSKFIVKRVTVNFYLKSGDIASFVGSCRLSRRDKHTRPTPCLNSSVSIILHFQVYVSDTGYITQFATSITSEVIGLITAGLNVVGITRWIYTFLSVSVGRFDRRNVFQIWPWRYRVLWNWLEHEWQVQCLCLRLE